MIRVVLDTNVLISALLFGGNPQRILEKVLSETLTMVLSREILEELEGVFGGPKLGFRDDVVRSIVREFESIAEVVRPSQRITAVKADPYDNTILECAVAAKVDYIISGDAHLLDLREFEGISIVSPAGFLQVVKERSGRAGRK